MRNATLAGATALVMTTGCAGMWTGPTDPQISGQVLCEDTEALRLDHARGLLTDGGPVSLSTGRNLLQTMQSGCAETGD